MGRPDKRLRALLERRRDHLAENANDLDEWRAALDKLWGTIEGWLQPFVDEGHLQWETPDREVGDDDCAPYRVRAGRASDGAWAWRVDFLPIRFVIGQATGRVDVVHGPRRHMLLRHGEGRDGRWEFLEDRVRPDSDRKVVWLERHHIITVLAEMLEPWMGLGPVDA